VILVDTSAWVEFLRATGSPAHLALRRLLGEDADLAITEPILMEVLAGARDDTDAARLRSRLLGLRMFPLEGLGDYEAAAAVYRACRAPRTPRTLIDCPIAVPAIRAGMPMFHNDADFDVIARHTPLRLWTGFGP